MDPLTEYKEAAVRREEDRCESYGNGDEATSPGTCQAGRYVRLVRLGYVSIALLFMAVLMLSDIRREEENTGYSSASQQSTVVLSGDVGWGSAAMAWLDGSKVLAVHGDIRPRHAADLPGSSLRAISLPAAVHRGAHPVLLPAQSQLADARIPCQADCGEEGAAAGVGNTLRYGHVNRKGQQQLAWWSKIAAPRILHSSKLASNESAAAPIPATADTDMDSSTLQDWQDAPEPRADQLPMGSSMYTWPNIINNKKNILYCTKFFRYLSSRERCIHAFSGGPLLAKAIGSATLPDLDTAQVLKAIKKSEAVL